MFFTQFLQKVLLGLMARGRLTRIIARMRVRVSCERMGVERRRDGMGMEMCVRRSVCFGKRSLLPSMTPIVLKEGSKSRPPLR